jgi:hypothetical protein
LHDRNHENAAQGGCAPSLRSGQQPWGGARRGLVPAPPGAAWRDGRPRKRNLIHEYFAQDGGKIVQIWAVMHYIETADPDSTGW